MLAEIEDDHWDDLYGGTREWEQGGPWPLSIEVMYRAQGRSRTTSFCAISTLYATTRNSIRSWRKSCRTRPAHTDHTPPGSSSGLDGFLPSGNDTKQHSES